MITEGLKPSSKSRLGTKPRPICINAGTYVLEPSVLGRIPDDRPVSIERETFPGHCRDGFAVAAGVRMLTGWIPAPPIRICEPIANILLGRRSGPPSPGAELDPSLGSGVWRIGDVEVQSSAVSRSLLGRNSLVGAEAVIEESVIGADAVIEEGASVIGSVLLAGDRAASKLTVERSVIAPVRSSVALRDSRRVGDRRRSCHRVRNGHRRSASRARQLIMRMHGHRWRRFHRIDLGGPTPGRGAYRRCARRSLHRLANQPGRHLRPRPTTASSSTRWTSARPKWST